MDLPDVVGLSVLQARQLLSDQCFAAIEETVTAPPRRSPRTGEWRVVRQRLGGECVELVTALFPVLALATAETICD
ncbi:MAG: hypothetical protein WCP21_08150 [Armatimonadota bacterium]